MPIIAPILTLHTISESFVHHTRTTVSPYAICLWPAWNFMLSRNIEQYNLTLYRCSPHPSSVKFTPYIFYCVNRLVRNIVHDFAVVSCIFHFQYHHVEVLLRYQSSRCPTRFTALLSRHNFNSLILFIFQQHNLVACGSAWNDS